jgi:hypothetical protein
VRIGTFSPLAPTDRLAIPQRGRTSPQTTTFAEEVTRMAKKGSSKTPPKYRSADTGRYVKPGYAKTHPKTTVKESK